jgi:hypothetical protein
MKALYRALGAEVLKMKRTLALWLAIIAPVLVVGLNMAMGYQRREFYRNQQMGAQVWFEFGLQTMVLWGLLMMPLFVTLETALIAIWEHGNQQWKHLFALPIPRGAIYAAKQVCGMALIGLSILVLTACLILGGLLLRYAAPGIGFEAAPPIGEFAEFGGFLFLGAWLIISIQTWVAQRWSSFAVASGVGIAMTVIGAVIIQSDGAGFYPYTLPILVANGFSDTIHPLNILEEGVRPLSELLFGSLGGVVAALLGGWEFVRRDVL